MFYSYFRHELSSGQIFVSQVVTYKPEYSRYRHMERAETLFMQDSDYILERLESDSERYRLETSLTCIPAYLSGLSLAEKVSFCQLQRDAFLQEFGTAVKPGLNTLHRHHLAWIKEVLHPMPNETTPAPDRESLASVIHMHVNRNFISEARKYEMILYHFFYRYYDSILARENLDLSKKR